MRRLRPQSANNNPKINSLRPVRVSREGRAQKSSAIELDSDEDFNNAYRQSQEQRDPLVDPYEMDFQLKVVGRETLEDRCIIRPALRGFLKKADIYSESLKIKQITNSVTQENIRLKTKLGMLQKQQRRLRKLEAATANTPPDNNGSQQQSVLATLPTSRDNNNLRAAALTKMLEEVQAERKFHKQQNIKIKRSAKYNQILLLETEKKQLCLQNQRLKKVYRELHEVRLQEEESIAYLDNLSHEYTRALKANDQLYNNNRVHTQAVEFLREQVQSAKSKAATNEKAMLKELADAKNELADLARQLEPLSSQLRSYRSAGGRSFMKTKVTPQYLSTHLNRVPSSDNKPVVEIKQQVSKLRQKNGLLRTQSSKDKPSAKKEQEKLEILEKQKPKQGKPPVQRPNTANVDRRSAPSDLDLQRIEYVNHRKDKQKEYETRQTYKNATEARSFNSATTEQQNKEVPPTKTGKKYKLIEKKSSEHSSKKPQPGFDYNQLKLHAQIHKPEQNSVSNVGNKEHIQKAETPTPQAPLKKQANSEGLQRTTQRKQPEENIGLQFDQKPQPLIKNNGPLVVEAVEARTQVLPDQIQFQVKVFEPESDKQLVDEYQNDFQESPAKPFIPAVGGSSQVQPIKQKVQQPQAKVLQYQEQYEQEYDAEEYQKHEDSQKLIAVPAIKLESDLPPQIQSLDSVPLNSELEDEVSENLPKTSRKQSPEAATTPGRSSMDQDYSQYLHESFSMMGDTNVKLAAASGAIQHDIISEDQEY